MTDFVRNGKHTHYENTADALTVHLSRISEKLRRQHLLCGAVSIWLRTNSFRKTPGNGLPAKQYSNSITIRLPHPTSSTQELSKYAESGLEAIFRLGCQYAKVGVMLTDLVPTDYRQGGLFTDGSDERLMQLAQTVDKVNKRYGHDTVRMTSQLYNPQWLIKPAYLSPHYTTRWEEIINVAQSALSHRPTT